MRKRGKVQTNQKKRRESAIVDHVMVNDGGMVKYKRNLGVDTVCEGWYISVKGVINELG